jgi:hypothetical protein
LLVKTLYLKMIWNIVNTTIIYIVNMFFPEEKQNECPLYWGLGTD